MGESRTECSFLHHFWKEYWTWPGPAGNTILIASHYFTAVYHKHDTLVVKTILAYIYNIVPTWQGGGIGLPSVYQREGMQGVGSPRSSIWHIVLTATMIYTFFFVFFVWKYFVTGRLVKVIKLFACWYTYNSKSLTLQD